RLARHRTPLKLRVTRSTLSSLTKRLIRQCSVSSTPWGWTDKACRWPTSSWFPITASLHSTRCWVLTTCWRPTESIRRRHEPLPPGTAANIYINLQGREPNGIVSKQEYLQLRAKIQKILSSFRDTNPTMLPRVRFLFLSKYLFVRPREV